VVGGKELVSEFACGGTPSEIDDGGFGKLQRLKAVSILPATASLKRCPVTRRDFVGALRLRTQPLQSADASTTDTIPRR
jgi:hypothetical protein